ncbi:glycosyl hydrolase family 18 protein [Klebsiella sp. PL-2018]|uniref:glycosyl hydrolase family 18 protein n=1 Tax=Klebsiella sp. PL-2018 TaxID=2851540 RepID=UPI001C22AC28|nr:glycosyl hydrolase family 18 protein [Klebsiella sp. PL-2018]QXD01136.1 Endo-beta-N-acetylglucosaminidase H precursor (Mannosyl-glycoprotein endo-beta-N-acetyl-glucosaminidase H) (DI-N-acetylchitobiosyl beta-N-acetylglucosaminidase H) (Endoglycosidase H) (Endo H) [Klebsiella sp. PL-2018]
MTIIKTPLTTVYIEVNSELLSNAACYYLEEDCINTLFDIAIIFAANINGSPEKPELYLNENVMKILNDAENQIRPLQGRGIKVLLSIVGNHQTAGISNFQSEEKAMNFANQVKNIVEKYGLNGVDLDDEYTDYRGAPARDDSVRWLISCLRNIMPNKIISLYDIGPAGYSMRTAPPDIAAKLNYAWNHDYGSFNPPEIQVNGGKTHLAAAAIELGKTPSYKVEELAEKTKDEGYGIFLTYNLKGGDRSKELSLFANILYEREIYYKAL